MQTYKDIDLSEKVEKILLDMMVDSMWPNHCEISKSRLNVIVGLLRRGREQAIYLRERDKRFNETP
jgi:hypothetical protein